MLRHVQIITQDLRASNFGFYTLPSTSYFLLDHHYLTFHCLKNLIMIFKDVQIFKNNCSKFPCTKAIGVPKQQLIEIIDFSKKIRRIDIPDVTKFARLVTTIAHLPCFSRRKAFS
jgi:hypothetical protein